MAKQEVATVQENLPAEFLDTLMQDSVTYEHTITQKDMSIPFLTIVQQLSPQRNKQDHRYIDGCEEGMICNTVTRELYDPDVGMMFVPIEHKRSFIEWVPRKSGGGFVKEWSVAEGEQTHPEHVIRNEAGVEIIQEGAPIGTPGNEMKETHTFYVLVIDPETGSAAPAVMTMYSTASKAARDLVYALNAPRLPNGKPYPYFAQLFKASTVTRSNDQGHWYVWSFDRVGPPGGVTTLENSGAIYEQAKSFAEGVMSGEHNVDHEAAQAATSGEAKPNGKVAENLDDEVPF